MSLSLNSQLVFQDFTRGYAIAMFIIWGLAVDIPRLLVRYGKAYPMVINIHSMLMLMLGLFTIMYVAAEIVMYQNYYGSTYAGLSGINLTQFVMSIVLACLVLVQFVLGFLVRVEMFKNKLSGSLFTVKRIHKISGYFIVLFGKIVATLVVYANTSELVFKAWLFSLGGFAILSIILQVIYRSQSRSIILSSFFKHKNKQHRFHNQIYQSLLDKKQKFNTYKNRGIRYVIIDNCMYYIDENFMHPGGERIFSLLNGKEINYYIKGAKAISSEYPRHTHTKYVTKYLQNRFIGELSVQPLLINQKLSNENVDWKIVSALKTNYLGTYVITFQNDSGYLSQSMRVDTFGKYVMMGCLTEQILSRTQRPYYICLSIGEYQKSVLDKYRKYYKYYYYNQQIQEENERKLNIESLAQRITFFVKEYRRGLFTRFLLNAPKDRVFSINGPYGKGLGLKEKSSGYYLLIAGGIGIMAFIDLFTFLLQKTLHDLIKIKASNPSLRKINEQNINYDSLSDLRILLVGTFTSSQKFYLSTAIKELYYLNKKHGLKTFNMMLHYQNTEIQHEVKMIKENFSSQFFTGLMEEEQPDRVIFSGPSTLEETLRRVEPELKLKTQITYL